MVKELRFKTNPEVRYYTLTNRERQNKSFRYRQIRDMKQLMIQYGIGYTVRRRHKRQRRRLNWLKHVTDLPGKSV